MEFVGKALGPVMDGVLGAWTASKGLGPNVEALKKELLYAQAVLDITHGREIRSGAVEELLLKLQQLAYDADDVLDELDYFRIHDELHGTFEAADKDAQVASGTLSCTRKLPQMLCFVAMPRPRSSISCLLPMALMMKKKNRSSSKEKRGRKSAAFHGDVLRKVKVLLATPFRAKVGKKFPCCSLPPPVQADAASGVMTDAATPDMLVRFHRVEMAKRVQAIVDELRPLCAQVQGILNLDCNRSKANDIKTRPIVNPDILVYKFLGREVEAAKIMDLITKGDSCDKDLTILPIVGLGGMGK